MAAPLLCTYQSTLGYTPQAGQYGVLCFAGWQSTLRPTLYRKTGNYIHSRNTTQIYTDRVTAQPQSHAHYYIWSACCIYSSTKSKYSSSMGFFQFSRPHISKRLDCLYSMLEPCILSVVWTLEKPST